MNWLWTFFDWLDWKLWRKPRQAHLDMILAEWQTCPHNVPAEVMERVVVIRRLLGGYALDRDTLEFIDEEISGILCYPPLVRPWRG